MAADLVRRGVTRPGRIAAEGGSNGGLLIANMLTRYPDRFGALLCTVPADRHAPLYEAARRAQHGIDEYGDPDKPEDWQFLQRRCRPITSRRPARTIRRSCSSTSRRDDRVHPGHARKMAAKLQAMGYEAHFYEPAAGGHSHGKDHGEQAAIAALSYCFLRRAVGWET